VDPNIVPRLIAVGIMLLLAFPIHEFSHALAAFRLGDSTARYQGRLTLDPRVHFDPIGGGMLALGAVIGGIFVGWAKPTPVNPYNLEGGRRGEALVALAGPASNLVMAAIAAVPFRLIQASPDMLRLVATNQVAELLYLVLFFFLIINVFLFVFNLLPIPPLDGWKVLLGFLDARTAYNLRQYEQYGFIVILLLFFLEFRGTGPIGLIAGAIIDFLTGS